jgi:hypothetical protein
MIKFNLFESNVMQIALQSIDCFAILLCIVLILLFLRYKGKKSYNKYQEYLKNKFDNDQILNYKNNGFNEVESKQSNDVSKHPIVLENVLFDKIKLSLQKYYRNKVLKGDYELGDDQAHRYGCHNEPISLIIQDALKPLIEKIVNKKLETTYTYLSSYLNGSSLPPHTDNLECQYTVSFLVGRDKEWPIYWHKIKQDKKNGGRYYVIPDKEEYVKLNVNPGGIIIFEGTDHIHFRDSYNGRFYDVLLLHYKDQQV